MCILLKCESCFSPNYRSPRRARARVWSDYYYFSFVISSRGLLKFRYCFSLAHRKKKQYLIDGKEVSSSYRSRSGKAKINFHTEKPSVIHTKHKSKKSQGRKIRENETTWESPYLLATSSGHKNCK